MPSRPAYRFRSPYLALLSTLMALFAPTDLSARSENHQADEPSVTIQGPPPPIPPAVVSRDDSGRATVRATRIAEPIVVDGALDDTVYDLVPPINGFIQQEPHAGEPATEPTDVWILFDDDNVYVSARCWDSHPERIIANEMRRDNGNIFQNETFTIVFDTFYDRRNGFFFQTNPLGALRDQAVGDEGEANNVDWNTVWNVKASIFDKGWIVEMVIPFKSLRFKAERHQIWGFNALRSVRWKNELSYLTKVDPAHRLRGIYRFSEGATLVGIEAPLASRNIELKPYALSSVVTNNSADPAVVNDLHGELGTDVKYGLTKGLIADLTYNTDFAQVEEDEQQVNLTRFSLFFPEKRDFFLEGQSIFAFGGVSLRGNLSNRPGSSNEELTPIMFFSRRIGLTSDGVDPILAGARVTGRSGGYRVGALNIQTEGIAGTSSDSTNFSVLRLRRDILGRSDVGVIATHRTTSLTEGASSNSLFGIDGNFVFLRNLRLNTYYSVTRTPFRSKGGERGDESSYLGRLDYGGDRYGLVLEHLNVGEDFKPELGFLRRGAFRRSFAHGRFSPRLAAEAIRRLVFQAEIDYIEGAATHIVETRRMQGLFQIERESGDVLSVEYNRQYEFLPGDFEISEDVVLPVGGYPYQDVRFAYQFGGQRAVPGTVTFRTGSFFGGDRVEVTYRGRVEVTPKFSIEPRLSLSFVDLPEGDFTAELYGGRFNLTLSPRTVISSLIQYNSSSSSLGSSLRLRWEYEPGSDLFVVYSDGRQTDATGFPLLLNRTFAIKLTKLFRF
jgi:hypothetical protein